MVFLELNFEIFMIKVFFLVKIFSFFNKKKFKIFIDIGMRKFYWYYL